MNRRPDCSGDSWDLDNLRNSGRRRVNKNDPEFDRGPVDSEGRLFDSTFGRKTDPHRLTAFDLAKMQEAMAARRPAEETTRTRATVSSTGPSGSASVDISSKMSLLKDSDFHLPTTEKLLVEIQNAYFDISRLEEKCTLSFKQAELRYGTEFNAEMYGDLYTCQVKLMNKYFDFMFLAYHPSGDSVTRGLVKRYKIPLRMWNKGIFKFLDILRSKLPDSKELIAKFIFHCFHLLSMLVEPPYESRHMWLEALGDIARFSMAVGDISNCDWRVISQYWYLQATNKSPGVGRLYHHCAVVCIYRLESLYYFCKSLTVLQPFAPSREIILSLFDSNKGEVNTPVASFITLHEINITQADSRRHELPELLSQVALGIQKDTEFRSRAALLAVCNISAIIGYGSSTNPYIKYFNGLLYDSELTEEAAMHDGNNDDSRSFGHFYVSKQVAFEILRSYISADHEDSVSHLIIWLHFLNELSDNQRLTHELVKDPMFPAQELVDYLNVVLQESISIIYKDTEEAAAAADETVWQRMIAWFASVGQRPHGMDRVESLNAKQNEQDIHNHYPLLRQRPLPEELLLYGLIWARKFSVSPMAAAYELPTNDELYPGCSNDPAYSPIRKVRLVRLAMDLTRSSTWIEFNESGFLLRLKFRLDDFV